MSYEYFGELTYRCLTERLSARQAAVQIGIGHTTLSRILRGACEAPSQHSALLIDRWLFPDETHPACSCVRCQGPHQSLLEERVGKLEEQQRELMVLIGGCQQAIHDLSRKVYKLPEHIRVAVDRNFVR